jgi:serine O-acetyltransferase
MTQSLKQTISLIRLDMLARSENEEKPLTAVRVIRFIFKSASMPIVIYRWQIFFYQHNIGLIASFLKLVNNILFTVKIDSKTEIGSGFLFFHSSYIYIGPNVIIGKNCRMSHQNTITPSAFYYPEASYLGKGPTIGDNLLLGCGASLVGDIVLGDNVKVAMNSTVDESFPNDAVLIGVPAINIGKKG